MVFYGRLAEIAGEYLRKGSQVYIEGSLRTSSYDKEGQKHYSTDIIANEMQMLGGRGQGGGGDDSFGGGRAPQARQGGGQNQNQNTSRSQSSADDFDDDIPF